MAHEAPHVAQFGREHRGGLGLSAPEAADTIDERLGARGARELLDAAVQLVPARELVLEQLDVLGEHDTVRLGERAGPQHLLGGSS